MSNYGLEPQKPRVLHSYTLRVVDPSEKLLWLVAEGGVFGAAVAHLQAGRYPPSNGNLESYNWRVEHHKGWDELIMNVNVWKGS